MKFEDNNNNNNNNNNPSSATTMTQAIVGDAVRTMDQAAKILTEREHTKALGPIGNVKIIVQSPIGTVFRGVRGGYFYLVEKKRGCYSKVYLTKRQLKKIISQN